MNAPTQPPRSSLTWLFCFAVLSSMFAPLTVSADTLELRAGIIIQGRYAGGNADTIQFDTGEGMKVLRRDDVLKINFSAPAAPPPPPAPPVAQAAPAAPASVIVPGGSLLVIQMKSQITSNDKAGKGFEGVLMHDLEADGVVVARAGTPVIGKVNQSKKAGRLAGKAKLEISLSQINADGKLVAIATSNYAEAGQGSFKKTARNAGVGALVGGAIDGGDGAGKGAAIGVAVSVIKKGESITIPPGAVLEFRLSQPVKMNSAR